MIFFIFQVVPEAEVVPGAEGVPEAEGVPKADKLQVQLDLNKPLNQDQEP